MTKGKVQSEQQDDALDLHGAATAADKDDAEGATARGGAEADEPEMLPAKRGQVWVTYTGHADAVSTGDITLRPGVPVMVPKDVAEGLLTTTEEFVVSTENPLSPAGRGVRHGDRRHQGPHRAGGRVRHARPDRRADEGGGPRGPHLVVGAHDGHRVHGPIHHGFARVAGRRGDAGARPP